MEKKLKKLIKLINEAAKLADELNVELGNGAEVGSLLGGIASELEEMPKITYYTLPRI